MKSYIKCPHCEFKLTGEMKHAIDTGKCPACGGEIALTDAIGVLEFVKISLSLNLPLSAENFKQLIKSYFIDTLQMKVPEIVFEEDVADRARRAVVRQPLDEVEEHEPSGVESPEAPKVPKAQGVPKLARGVKLSAEDIAEVKRGLGVLPISQAGNPNKVDQFSGNHPGDKAIKFITLTREQRKAMMGGLGSSAIAPESVEIPEEPTSSQLIAPLEEPSGNPDRPVRLVPKMPKLSSTASSGGSIISEDAVLTPKRTIAGGNQ